MTRRPGGPGLALGRVAGIPVRLDASWFLVAAALTVFVAPVAAAELPGIGAGRYVVGLLFAVLLYASVFVHELAHALTARRLGLSVTGITITLFGGITEIVDDEAGPGRDALVAAVGPLASLLVGALALLAAGTIDGDVPRFLVLELAWASLLVGLFNLLPTPPLDGGHLLKAAVWAASGDLAKGHLVSGAVGVVVGAGVALAPWLLSWPDTPRLITIVWSAVIAWFLVAGGRSAMAVGRLRARLPGLTAGRLARRATLVEGTVPLAEAVRRVRAEQAQGLVVVDAAGHPRGVVDEAVVSAVPDERRPWLTAADVARSVDDGASLSSSMSGLALVRRLQGAPAATYLVVDDAGRVVGVLLPGDVEAALAT